MKSISIYRKLILLCLSIIMFIGCESPVEPKEEIPKDYRIVFKVYKKDSGLPYVGLLATLHYAGIKIPKETLNNGTCLFLIRNNSLNNYSWYIVVYSEISKEYYSINGNIHIGEQETFILRIP